MPLIQSGLALVASTLISSGLGVVFWIVAARQFTSAEVGVSSALITSMILLADVGHLGLRTGLVRFLPVAGDQAERLVLRAYGLAAAVAALGSVVFVAGIRLWSPELVGIRDSFGSVALFVLATVFWVVFLLEDSVLLGLRLTRWVPVENGLFGAVKIVLLLVLAGTGGDLGVFLAWAIPVFAVVLAVNGLVVRNLRGRGAAEGRAGGEGRDGGPAGLPPLRAILTYSLTDWSASAARTAVIGVLPLLVLARLGREETAYYMLAWTIAFSIYILSANIGDALVAEASYDEGNVDRHTLHSGLLSMGISAPIVLVAALAAPWVLGVFGREYADNATPVLRLLLVGAIPNVVTRTYVGRLRAERRMGTVVAYETALSAGILVLAWLLLGALGINGIGITWLICLGLAAVYTLVVESVWWWAPRLDPRLVQRITTAARRVRRTQQRRPVLASRRAVGEVVDQLYTTRADWRRERFSSESQMVLVAGHEGRPPLQVEVATTPWGAEILERRVAAIAGLGELTGLASFRALLPYPIEHHTDPAPAYLVESAHSGRLGHHLIDETPVGDLVEEVVGGIGLLHGATAGRLLLDDDQLDHWVSRPVADLRRAGRIPPEQLGAVEAAVRGGLAGAVVASARIHGNLVLANTRFDSAGRLTGITGWEWSETGPAFLDRGVLALSCLSLTAGVDLGAVVSELLGDPERFFLHPAFADFERDGLDARAAVLVSWLTILGPVIRGPVCSQPGRYWFARTVRTVTQSLAPAPA